MGNDFVTVVGLGNPGSQYDSTRHNVGFAVIDLLQACSGLGGISEIQDFASRNATSAIAGGLGRTGWKDRSAHAESHFTFLHWSAHLIKPMSFMNRSGEPLQGFFSYKKIALSQVIVIHDEIDIPLGTVRVKADGGEGGHNGLRSISESCGGRGYARVRVGVGKPPLGSPLWSVADGMATWVLGRFSGEDKLVAEQMVVKSVLAVVELGTNGLRAAQNRFNG